MKANIEFDLKPFTVPNFVIVKDSLVAKSDGIALNLVPSDTLYKLCKQFVEDVYKKAGKEKDMPQFISQRQGYGQSNQSDGGADRAVAGRELQADLD